jgi:hypothetical protein
MNAKVMWRRRLERAETVLECMCMMVRSLEHARESDCSGVLNTETLWLARFLATSAAIERDAIARERP